MDLDRYSENSTHPIVMPAKAGIHPCVNWIPACAGMTALAEPCAHFRLSVMSVVIMGST